MKVLKNPYPEGPWKAEVKCIGSKDPETKGCHAKLEISEEDLMLFHWFGDFFEHTYVSAKCPICGEILRNLKVPQYVCDRWKKSHPKAKSVFSGVDNRVY